MIARWHGSKHSSGIIRQGLLLEPENDEERHLLEALYTVANEERENAPFAVMHLSLNKKD